MLTTSAKRRFSEAARTAAAEARRLKREQVVDLTSPEVFVLRGGDDPLRFEWQIRRFGGVVLARSRVTFKSVREAHVAGSDALKVFNATCDGPLRAERGRPTSRRTAQV